MRWFFTFLVGVGISAACTDYTSNDGEPPTTTLTDAGPTPESDGSTNSSRDGATSGGEPVLDAGITPRVVQMSSRNVTTSGKTTHTATIRANAAAGVNDLLVLAIANQYGNAYPVQSVKDNVGHEYELAIRSLNSTGYTSEIWWTKTMMPGANELTVELGGNIRLDLWLIDATGVSGLDKAVSKKDATVSSDNVLEALGVTTSLPSLVVSAMFYGGTTALGDLDKSNGFEEIDRKSAFHAAAWKIATTPGSYGARWTATSAFTYSAVTASFKP